MKPRASSASPTVRIDPVDWARLTGEKEALLGEIKFQLKAKRRRRAKAATVAATIGCLAFLVFWGVPYVRSTGDVATPAGHRQTVALADGSQAELNARTALHTDFRYGRRTVRLLAGEAFFAVERDPAHPFLVETPRGVVRVLGTRFNVRLGTGGEPEVTLVEGAVEVAGTGVGPVRLAPAEQFAVGGTKRTLSAAELAGVTAWRKGQIVLEGLTLGEAVARFAAYHGIRFEVAPAVAAYHLGGVCSLDDLDGFVAAVQEAAPVAAVRQADGSYVVSPR